MRYCGTMSQVKPAYRPKCLNADLQTKTVQEAIFQDKAAQHSLCIFYKFIIFHKFSSFSCMKLDESEFKWLLCSRNLELSPFHTKMHMQVHQYFPCAWAEFYKVTVWFLVFVHDSLSANFKVFLLWHQVQPPHLTILTVPCICKEFGK